jgi:3-hydroxybutyryl-CoA dehydrogenase
MGNGIAQACAVKGINVVMVDISEAAVAKGPGHAVGSLDRLVKKEKITADDKAAALALIKGSTSLRRPESSRPRHRSRDRELRLKVKILQAA